MYGTDGLDATVAGGAGSVCKNVTRRVESSQGTDEFVVTRRAHAVVGSLVRLRVRQPYPQWSSGRNSAPPATTSSRP
jgi:hypothetical protein